MRTREWPVAIWDHDLRKLESTDDLDRFSRYLICAEIRARITRTGPKPSIGELLVQDADRRNLGT